MRAFGRQFSNWWLLALAPIALIALPVLLMGFFVGNEVAGAIVGPPAIGNRPWRVPSRPDLIGTYTESERHLDESRQPAVAGLVLRADGSMTVANLPADFGRSTCTLSGSGS